MNATMSHEGTFVGISANSIAEIVGPDAAARLLEIDHAHLCYGEHWKWIGGAQIFTQAGLELIAEKLGDLGFKGAAVALATETRRRVEACAPLPTEAERADAVLAQRWDLRGDNA